MGASWEAKKSVYNFDFAFGKIYIQDKSEEKCFRY